MLVTFRGPLNSLVKWKDLVSKTVGQAGGDISCTNRDTGRYKFDVELTTEETLTLRDRCWHEESGTGTRPNGLPLRWKDCITFQIESNTED